MFRSTDLGKRGKKRPGRRRFPKRPKVKKGFGCTTTFGFHRGTRANRGHGISALRRKDCFVGGRRYYLGPVNGFNRHPLFKTWWNPPDEGPPDGPTLHSVLIDPRDANHMFFCLSGGGVFESHDKGRDWCPLNKGLVSDFLPVPDAEVGHDPHRCEMNPLDPDRLYQQFMRRGAMDRKEGVWVNIGQDSYRVAMTPIRS